MWGKSISCSNICYNINFNSFSFIKFNKKKNRKVGNKIDSNIIQIEILNREIKIEEVTNLIKKH